MDAVGRLNAALTGRYAIEHRLGQGGMATVYLAQDLRHHRRVALKVLKPELTAVLGPERFLSEIQVTANLQHPHLVPLFDSGEADGLLFYVMPYVEGESLRARLERERQLPVDEALAIATAIADALAYAHRRNVIHRDLKPENILLHEGQPLLADFGIALAVSNAGGGRITQTGISLGTPQYMSPEQATADRAIDARSDIYSLAAVLYEMLTGDPPHMGNTAQAILVRVLTEKPHSVRTIRASVAEHVDAAIARALEKLPADRFSDAHEFAEALQGRLHAAPPSPVPPVVIPAAAGERWWGRRSTVLAVGVMGVVGGAVAALGFVGRSSDWPESRTLLHAFLEVPTGARPSGQFPIAFSPDGRHLVYSLTTSGTSRLYLRSLDADAFEPIPNTDGGESPFFSPDGRWIAFFAAEKMWKVAVAGGPRFPIADADNHRGGSWGTDDAILFAPTPYSGLFAVPAAGGTPRLIARPEPASGVTGHTFPQLLPNGKAILFTAGAEEFEQTKVVAQLLETGETRVLVAGGAHGRYVSTGHLVYGRGGTLMAAAFDPERLKLKGSAVPLVEDVYHTTGTGGAATASFAFSSTGLLVYLSGGFQPVRGQLLWVDRTGKAEPLPAPPQDYWYPRVSPNGQLIAVTVRGAPRSDLWLYAPSRDEFNRVTFEGASWRPVWSPDGSHVAFGSTRGASQSVLRMAVGSDGALQRLATGEYVRPRSWSPDGRLLALVDVDPVTNSDIWLVPADGSEPPQPWVRTRYSETDPAFSPNGRWLAYASDETGRSEVYVRSVTGGAGRWQISSDGGSQPVWGRNGRELFFVNGERFMAAPVTSDPGFDKGTPIVLFEMRRGGGSYDRSPDGRFLIVQPVESASAPDLHLMVNWVEALKAR